MQEASTFARIHRQDTYMYTHVCKYQKALDRAQLEFKAETPEVSEEASHGVPLIAR